MFALLGIPLAHAATVTVPGDYDTLQDAWNAAQSGDVIVAAALISETGDFTTSGIALRVNGMGWPVVLRGMGDDVFRVSVG